MAYTFSTLDRIETTLASHSSIRTWAMWTYRTGNGGGNEGRVFSKNVERLQSSTSSGGQYRFVRNDSTGDAAWSIVRPAADAWHHMLVTYDSGDTNNDPVMYLDGVSQTVTELSAPGITPTENALNIFIGNHTDPVASDRNWAGRLCEFAVWDRILNAAEAAGIGGKSLSPEFYPNSLVSYVKLIRNVTDRMRAAPTNTGATVVEHPRIIYAAPTRTIHVPAAAAVGNPWYAYANQ